MSKNLTRLEKTLGELAAAADMEQAQILQASVIMNLLLRNPSADIPPPPFKEDPKWTNLLIDLMENLWAVCQEKYDRDGGRIVLPSPGIPGGISVSSIDGFGNKLIEAACRCGADGAIDLLSTWLADKPWTLVARTWIHGIRVERAIDLGQGMRIEELSRVFYEAHVGPHVWQLLGRYGETMDQGLGGVVPRAVNGTVLSMNFQKYQFDQPDLNSQPEGSVPKEILNTVNRIEAETDRLCHGLSMEANTWVWWNLMWFEWEEAPEFSYTGKTYLFRNIPDALSQSEYKRFDPAAGYRLTVPSVFAAFIPSPGPSGK